MDKLSFNGMALIVEIEDEKRAKVMTSWNFEKDFGDDFAQFNADLITGLEYMMRSAPEAMSQIGAMVRFIAEIDDELDDCEIVFEPDEALVKAVSQSKVVEFNPKKWNH
jgi:hypothetical protein